jgi:hypothetical protein
MAQGALQATKAARQVPVPPRIVARPGAAATRSAQSRSPRQHCTRAQREASRDGTRRTLKVAFGGGQDGDLAGRIRGQLGRGERLPDDIRARAEADLAQPLGEVRFHRDPQAATLAADLSARAFTAGQDIFFSHGAYDPATPGGYELLTHELAHSVQQSSGPVAAHPVSADLAVSHPADRDERAAAAVARRAATGAPTGEAGSVRPDTTSSSARPGSVVQRDLAAYTREHLTVIPIDPEAPPLMETAAASASEISAALKALVSAGKVGVRPEKDTLVYSGTGATSAEVIAAFAAAGYPKAVQMAGALLDPHMIVTYTPEDKLVSAGLFGTTTLSQTKQKLDTQTTRGLTAAERKAAESVYGSSIDYDHIVLDDAVIMGIGGYARTTPWTINFPAGTLAGGGPDTSWLIHELGHSWQYQRGVSLMTTLHHAVFSSYDYGGEAGLAKATAAGKGLSSFNTEQQADIAKDAYQIMIGIHKGNLAVYQPYLDEFRSGKYR